MFRSDTRALVLSVGDLVQASKCEYALLREVDRVLGRIERPAAVQLDSAWTKLARSGTEHEKRHLGEYRARFGSGNVVEIPRVIECTDSALRMGFQQTLDALKSGANVIYQAVIYDGRLLGYADFVVRDDDGRWRVEDTKLAASAGVEARLQVAAYSTLLAAAGVELTAAASIALGDGTEVDVPLVDVVPAFMHGRARAERIVDDHVRSCQATVWNPEAMLVCFSCASCRQAIAATRDICLVNGVGPEERRLLRNGGIHTIDQLVATDVQVAELPRSAFVRLRKRAALQLQAGELPNVPAFEVIREDLLGRIPRADPGDLFLSFAAQGRPSDSGADPDHLFSVMAVNGAVQTYWGDDRRTEATEFVSFLTDVRARRTVHPGMRIHHYSPVDRPHLTELADRSGAGRRELDQLLDEGVFVDLFTAIDDAVLVGTPDRSLREVGRLADPELAHTLSVLDASVQRAEYRRLLQQGDPDRATALRSLLERENLERCMLTKRLRDWLLDLMAAAGVQPGSVAVLRRTSRVASEVARALDAAAHEGGVPAHAIAVAALEYHSLEASVFWRAHERRLHRHTTEWSGRTRGAAKIVQLRVEQDWTKGARGGLTRTLRVRVSTSPGTTFKVEDQPFLVYDGPQVFDDSRASPGSRTATGGEVLERIEDELLVRERLPKGATPWSALPSALAPSRPPRTSAIETAVERWAASLLRDDQSTSAVADLVLRQSPRLRSSGLARVGGIDGRIDVHASLLQTIEDLDGSFLAVQGPPGSGKTTVGARAIADLVQRGWRIGVVAQSRAVVEHFLEQVVRSGADPGRVAKHSKGGQALAFTKIGKDGVRTFTREHADGFVVGGTAWTFTNPRRVSPDSLDLLVIDEAGQFGLVNAIAVGQSARNLLLLGDPQQLPQVSQASHRAAVDSSALGWLLDGAALLPDRFGYFLDRTWRMHPALTRAVSDLSYDNELGAHGLTRTRSLSGLAPGLHLRPVRHVGRTDASPEEAAEVVRVVRYALDRTWQASAATAARPMTQRDVIVVAPYNAQVERISQALTSAGLAEIEVGTVDRFQGREAVIAIYSATVSSLALRPQAADFVLNRNRLNVAISRAQWAAFIVHSTRLADFSPRNFADTAALSRFLRLLEFASESSTGENQPDEPFAS